MKNSVLSYSDLMSVVEFPKSVYLASLKLEDRCNLEVLLGAIKRITFPEPVIIAIGSSVEAYSDDYNDIDIKVFGTKHTFPDLSKLVHQSIRDLSDEIEGLPASRIESSIAYLIRHLIPYWLAITVFRLHPREGKSVDILISPHDFETYRTKMEKIRKPYVILD